MDAGPCQLRARGAGALSVTFEGRAVARRGPHNLPQVSSERQSQVWVVIGRGGNGWKSDPYVGSLSTGSPNLYLRCDSAVESRA